MLNPFHEITPKALEGRPTFGEDPRQQEQGLKIDLTEFLGSLIMEEFPYWFYTVKEILESKKV